MVIKELEEEEREKNNLNPKTERAPRKLLKEKLHIYIYIVRGCYVLIKTVDVVRKK